VSTPPDTWGSLHAGDVVLGNDGQEWGVEATRRTALFVSGHVTITLVRHGMRATAGVAAHLPVVVVRRADTSEEYRAAGALLAGGLTPEVIEERWES
jgi:hypothetical protein